MQNDSLEVSIKAVAPAAEGCAVFLGAPKKIFVIYVDSSVGQSLSLALSTVKKERPLTHDLMTNICAGFGISFERMVINDALGTTFYARIILKMDNELGTKIVEVDARPSDAMVLALNAGKPIMAAASLLEKVEDATALMHKLTLKRPRP